MYKQSEDIEMMRAQLNAIFQSSYDGMYITDGKGLFLNVNNGMERITGIKKEDMIGTYAKNLVKSGIINCSVVEMALETKERITIKQTINSDKIKEVMVTATPILDNEANVQYVIANLRDMTDLMYLENECNKAQWLSKQYYSELIRERKYKDKIVAESEEMKQLLQLAYRVAQVDSTILLEGESGTGKEVIAHFIHEMSPRRGGPFVSINCAGVPESLLEAELFGYDEGAFTGAKKSGKVGLIELAEGGTLFLDEINSLPISLQGKLLRVIETFEIVRLGSTKSNKVNYRLIAATNKSLEELVDKGLFRQDLYFRLKVVPITLIPLRKRKNDIRPLSLYFLQYFNKKYNTNKELSAEVLKYLEEYHWTGNVRELKNIIERLIVTTKDNLIIVEDLPDKLLVSLSDNNKFQIILKDIVPLNKLIDEAEKKLISLAAKQYKSTREVAKALEISQTSVVRKMKKVQNHKKSK